MEIKNVKKIEVDHVKLKYNFHTYIIGEIKCREICTEFCEKFTKFEQLSSTVAVVRAVFSIKWKLLY